MDFEIVILLVRTKVIVSPSFPTPTPSWRSVGEEEVPWHVVADVVESPGFFLLRSRKHRLRTLFLLFHFTTLRHPVFVPILELSDLFGRKLGVDIRFLKGSYHDLQNSPYPEPRDLGVWICL